MENLHKKIKKELKEIVNNLPTYTDYEKLDLIYELQLLFLPYIKSELKFNELKKTITQRIELSKCSEELSRYVFYKLECKNVVDLLIYKFFYEFKNEQLKELKNEQLKRITN